MLYRLARLECISFSGNPSIIMERKNENKTKVCDCNSWEYFFTINQKAIQDGLVPAVKEPGGKQFH